MFKERNQAKFIPYILCVFVVGYYVPAEIQFDSPQTAGSQVKMTCYWGDEDKNEKTVVWYRSTFKKQKEETMLVYKFKPEAQADFVQEDFERKILSAPDEQSTSSHTLYLKYLSVDDTGHYWCVIYTSDIEHPSKPKALQLKSKFIIPYNIKKLVLYLYPNVVFCGGFFADATVTLDFISPVLLNSDVKLSCSYSSRSPLLNKDITWHRYSNGQSEMIAGNDDTSFNARRGFTNTVPEPIPKNYTGVVELELADVTEEDDGTIYWCEFKSQYSPAPVQSNNRFLYVQGKPWTLFWSCYKYQQFFFDI